MSSLCQARNGISLSGQKCHLFVRIKMSSLCQDRNGISLSGQKCHIFVRIKMSYLCQDKNEISLSGQKCHLFVRIEMKSLCQDRNGISLSGSKCHLFVRIKIHRIANRSLKIWTLVQLVAELDGISPLSVSQWVGQSLIVSDFASTELASLFNELCGSSFGQFCKKLNCSQILQLTSQAVRLGIVFIFPSLFVAF